MKRSAGDPKPSHHPESRLRTLDDRRLQEVRAGSSIIKPAQLLISSGG
jgi:hypothetical protein